MIVSTSASTPVRRPMERGRGEPPTDRVIQGFPQHAAPSPEHARDQVKRVPPSRIVP